MKTVKFVYTLSDRGKMVSQTCKSVNSLLKFVSKEDIIVFFTPPRSSETLNKLLDITNVVQVPNITKPFVFAKERGLGYYGEKVHLCTVEYPNVVFLDCDTIIKKNVLDLLKGDYDFSARVGEPLNSQMDKGLWEKMCFAYGKSPIYIPNTGFMIFKNYCHLRIGSEWLRLINSNLENPHPRNNLKEQYALALAVSGKRIRWMNPNEHAFTWLNEQNIDTYVLHGNTSWKRWLRNACMQRKKEVIFCPEKNTI